MTKNVLLLTSTNLSGGPRCLKEVRLFLAMNLHVTVVAFNLQNWTNNKEAELNRELDNVTFHYLESTRIEIFPWLFSSLLERFSRVLFPLFSSNIFLAAMAVNKRSWLLLHWAKKWDKKPDLIIAHNPPAFYAASWLAEKNSIPFALDIEDYHPGEGENKRIQFPTAFLMKKLIKKAMYTSFASPLIKVYSENLAGKTNNPNYLVINNVFPLADFTDPSEVKAANKKIQLVWFSQFIDYGRGLEALLPVLDNFHGAFELTLIGSLRESFYSNELEGRKYVHCLPSLSQKQLHHDLQNYDIGLAIEDKQADINRNICLTNKIWSYFQAGLYIVASDTDAQKAFLHEHPDHGTCISLSAGNLHESFENLALNINPIRAARGSRFQRAVPYSWDHERNKLLDVLKNIGFQNNLPGKT